MSLLSQLIPKADRHTDNGITKRSRLLSSFNFLVVFNVVAVRMAAECLTLIAVIGVLQA